MPMAIKFGRKPVAPSKLNKLYQGIIKADGTWVLPTGAIVEVKPTDWNCKHEGEGKYTLSHTLNTRDITIQITMRVDGTQYRVVDINDNAIVIETLGVDGSPAPCEWKFALRKNH